LWILRRKTNGSIFQVCIQDVKGAMERRNAGTLKSGKSGKTVKSKKQAIAIGLSEARAKGRRCHVRNPHEVGGRPDLH
jgi:hypothetical protein